MGNSVGGRRRRPAVEERYTRPQGLYPDPDIDLKKLRRLILEAKLAPCHMGCDDPSADLDQCPICLLFYPSLNRSKCCARGICTECFLQMKSPTSSQPTQCPYCKMLNYAVEYRGSKTKEEKLDEQIEEQKVIEAQIRMRQQELQDDAERLKNKKAAALTDAVTTAQVESCDTGGTSTPAASGVQGNDLLSSQVQNPELLLKNAERLKQIRGNNFDMVDLEDVMLMEAVWLSMQDQEALGNSGIVDAAPPIIPPRCNGASATTPAEISSGGFACAVAALAEQQVMFVDSPSAAACHASRHDILSRSDMSSAEDLSTAESSFSGTRFEEPSSSSGTHQTRDCTEYPNDRWSEVAEASTSCAGSDITAETGADNLAASDGSSIGSGNVPDSFEEQMRLAMALSMVDVVRPPGSSSPGLAWR